MGTDTLSLLYRTNRREICVDDSKKYSGFVANQFLAATVDTDIDTDTDTDIDIDIDTDTDIDTNTDTDTKTVKDRYRHRQE